MPDVSGQYFEIFILYNAFFLMQASNNVEKAREILLEGLENAQYSKPLLEVCSLSLSIYIYIYIYIYISQCCQEVLQAR